MYCECGDEERCVFCGRTMRCHTSRPCINGDGVVSRTAQPGLGDYVEKVLSSVGITKERIERVTGKPCGCGARQKALNSFGDRIMSAFKKR